MPIRFTGRVIPWSSRVKFALPFLLAVTALVLFATGMASSRLRTDPSFRPFLWGMLIAAALFTMVWAILQVVLGARVEVGDDGVRVIGRATLDLGRPRGLRHGRFAGLAGYGRGARRRKVMGLLWLAIEGADGRVVVFLRPSSGGVRLPDWPFGEPPVVPDAFDCFLDPAALRIAVESVIGPPSGAPGRATGRKRRGSGRGRRAP